MGDRAAECSTGGLSGAGSNFRPLVERTGCHRRTLVCNRGFVSGGVPNAALRNGLDCGGLGYRRSDNAQEPLAGAGSRRSQYRDLDRRTIFEHHFLAGISVPRERQTSGASSRRADAGERPASY